jgi:hypothetical protein
MNTTPIFELIEIAISLVHSQGDGTIQGDAEVAQVLYDIVQHAAKAYEDHTGEPINLDAIPAAVRV